MEEDTVLEEFLDALIEHQKHSRVRIRSSFTLNAHPRQKRRQ